MDIETTNRALECDLAMDITCSWLNPHECGLSGHVHRCITCRYIAHVLNRGAGAVLSPLDRPS